METEGETMTLTEYERAEADRRDIISRNRSRRMLKVPLSPLPVPPRPDRPVVPIAYDRDGNYSGRLVKANDCPVGCTVKWEPAIW